MRRDRRKGAGLACAALVMAGLVGVSVGAVSLSRVDIVLSLADRLPLVDVRHDLSSMEQAVLWDIRVPRVVLAAMVGGALSIAGASYQGVFRNPLADPYLLGAAAGAGLGATISIAYMHNVGWVAPLAFVGALSGVALSYAIGAAAGPGAEPATFLLAGIAVMSFLTALQTFLQQRRNTSLQQVYSWVLGQLGTSGWDDVRAMAPYLALSVVTLLAFAKRLDILAIGDDKALSLGVSPATTRLIVITAASLATAAAVSVSGLIGFVGLVVPHVARRLAGSSYRAVLPTSLVGGAAFLVLADCVARTALSPAELPIGVVTAFAGAPFFAGLLRASRHRPA